MRKKKEINIMNIVSTANVRVLAKNTRTGSNNQTYYNLAVFANGEAGNVPCTKEAFDFATENEENELTFAYNEQYKSMRVTGAKPILNIQSGKPAGK
jgi:hypothetical protein